MTKIQNVNAVHRNYDATELATPPIECLHCRSGQARNALTRHFQTTWPPDNDSKEGASRPGQDSTTRDVSTGLPFSTEEFGTALRGLVDEKPHLRMRWFKIGSDAVLAQTV